jgi:hypothetical protein
MKGEQLKDPGADERKILKWTVGVIGGRVLDSSMSGQRREMGSSVHDNKCPLCIKYGEIFSWLRNV